MTKLLFLTNERQSEYVPCVHIFRHQMTKLSWKMLYFGRNYTIISLLTFVDSGVAGVQDAWGDETNINRGKLD